MGSTANSGPVEALPARTWRTPDGREIDAAAAVVAFRAGDQRALETLIGCFSRMMSTVARRYLHVPADVEDAVQEAWMAFIRTAGSITSPQSVGAWLSTTTAHAAIVIGKRQARCVPSDPAFSASLEAPPDGADVTEEGTTAAVRDAVRRLADDDRLLVDLLFNQGLSYAQVVDRTGRPIGAIGPTRQRIMRKLQRDRAIRDLAATDAG